MNIDSLSIPDLPKNAFHQAFFNVLALNIIFHFLKIMKHTVLPPGHQPYYSFSSFISSSPRSAASVLSPNDCISYSPG